MSSTIETLPQISIPNPHRFSILNAIITHLENTDNNGSSSSSSPASKASIDALESVQLTEECAICLDDKYEDNYEGREMPCKHKFHKKCIFKWLNMNGNCPICRYRMPEEEKSSDDDDDDKSTVGSGEEARVGVRFVRIVFVSASRLGSHEADDSDEEEDLDWISSSEF